MNTSMASNTCFIGNHISTKNIRLGYDVVIRDNLYAQNTKKLDLEEMYFEACAQISLQNPAFRQKADWVAK